VRRLAAEELCTCQLVDMTGAPQPTVSCHLKVLRDAGWVTSEPAVRSTYYALEAAAVRGLADARRPRGTGDRGRGSAPRL